MIDTENARASARTVLSGLFAIVLVVNLAVGVGLAAQENAVPGAGGDTTTLSAAIDEVPENASVFTQNTIFPHIAERENASFVVNQTVYYQYLRNHDQPTPEYVLIDTDLGSRAIDWSNIITTIFEGRLGTEYGLHYYEDEVWVFERGYDGPPRGVTGSYGVETRTYDRNQFTPNSALVIGDQLVGSGGEAGTYYWYGPGAMLPPGNYTANFLVNASSTGDQPVATLEVAAGATPVPVANTNVTNTDGLQNVTVPFSLDRVRTNVEFRAVQAGGEGRLAFENVTVAARSDAANATR